VLSREHRLRRSGDFGEVVRSGARAGSDTVVVHLHLAQSAGEPRSEARIGFIVNKSVGSAVMRNRVRRQLRHECRALVTDLPQGTRIVVRALPAAAGARSRELAADLESCVGRAVAKAERMVTT
jgi:ribonuclease P protein component